MRPLGTRKLKRIKTVRAALPVAALAFALISTPAYAMFTDGNGLLRQCNDGENSSLDTRWQSSARCSAYVVGVVDTADQIRACLPEGVDIGQMTDVVHLYLKQHPESRQKNASFLVQLALHVAFCEQK